MKNVWSKYKEGFWEAQRLNLSCELNWTPLMVYLFDSGLIMDAIIGAVWGFCLYALITLL